MSGRTVTILLLGLVLVSGPAQAQNLVTNGDFPSAVAPWTVGPPAPPGSVVLAFDAADALGLPGTGSLRSTWNLPTTSAEEVLLQSECLGPVMEPDGVFRAGWSAQIPDDLPADVTIRFCSYDLPSCTIGISSACAPTTLTPSPGGFFFDVDLFNHNDLRPYYQVEIVTSVPVGELSAGDLLLDKVFLRSNDEITTIQSISEVVGSNFLTVAFSGSTTGGASPFQRIFTWDFGDGETSSEQNPTHTFDTPGTYFVLLTVDSGFESAETFLEVEVTAPPGVVEIPTLDGVGILVLVVLLALLGLWIQRRRTQHN